MTEEPKTVTTEISYNENPSTSWKLIASPAKAPSNSGVPVSSPQTAKDCWPPCKSSAAKDALPTNIPELDVATIYGASDDKGRSATASLVKNTVIFEPVLIFSKSGRSHWADICRVEQIIINKRRYNIFFFIVKRIIFD